MLLEQLGLADDDLSGNVNSKLADFRDLLTDVQSRVASLSDGKG